MIIPPEIAACETIEQPVVWRVESPQFCEAPLGYGGVRTTLVIAEAITSKKSREWLSGGVETIEKLTPGRSLSDSKTLFRCCSWRRSFWARGLSRGTSQPGGKIDVLVMYNVLIINNSLIFSLITLIWEREALSPKKLVVPKYLLHLQPRCLYQALPVDQVDPIYWVVPQPVPQVAEVHSPPQHYVGKRVQVETGGVEDVLSGKDRVLECSLIGGRAVAP